MNKNQSSRDNSLKSPRQSKGSFNPCSRCGKERIMVSVEEEIVNNSKIVTTVMVCPDPDCQKKVEEQLDRERVKREKFSEHRYDQHKSSGDDD